MRKFAAALQTKTQNPGASGLLQRRLRVAASNDPLEQEADRVADQVLAKAESVGIGGGPPRIQRFNGSADAGRDIAPASVERVLTVAGRPLDAALQQDMGRRFGHDFSRVRVHASAAAAQSARDVSALAYTAGNDIVFGAEQFAPGTHAGRRLLAHELTHVVQQSTALPAAPLQKQPAPAAPAAGGATKNISIDAVKLRGASRDPSADVTFANNVFKPANVQFSLGKNETASNADSDKWLGGDTTITTGTCGAASQEELDTWNGSTAKFTLSGRLRAFYVEKISTGSRADSYPPYCATGTAAALKGLSTVSNSAASRSLAHELGHILIDSADHPADAKNLMHPTNTATGNDLTATQQATIYANA